MKQNLYTAVLCMWLLLLAGCGPTHKEYDKAVADVDSSIKNARQNQATMFEAQIAEYRARMRDQVDRLAANAVTAESHPDGTGNVHNVALIMARKQKMYDAIEANIADMRTRAAPIDIDLSNAQAYNNGLSNYFNQKNDPSQLLNDNADALINALGPLLKRAATTSPGVGPPLPGQ